MTSTRPSTRSPSSSAPTTISAPDASSVEASSPSEQLTRADLIIDLALAATMLGREAARAGGVEQSTTLWFALTELNEQPMRLGELARRIGISQPATSALVRKLKEQGRIEITADSADGRAKLLTVTPGGRTDLKGWRSQTSGVLAAALGDLSASDDLALQRALVIITGRRGLIEGEEHAFLVRSMGDRAG